MAKLDHLKLDRRFKLIDPLTGAVTEFALQGLSCSLRLNSILCEVQVDGSLEHLGLITYHDLVLFARTWAGWVNPEPIQEVARVFDLLDRWLEDPGAVTTEELRDAAGYVWAARSAAEAAWAAAEDDEYAAGYAAGSAAEAAGSAARSAVEAAGSAAEASWAARTAGYAARTAGYAAEAAMYQRQGELVLEILRSR